MLKVTQIINIVNCPKATVLDIKISILSYLAGFILYNAQGKLHIAQCSIVTYIDEIK